MSLCQDRCTDATQAATVRSIQGLFGKLQGKLASLPLYNFAKASDMFTEQMGLNRAILRLLCGREPVDSWTVQLSCILHQPLVDYAELDGMFSTIKQLL